MTAGIRLLFQDSSCIAIKRMSIVDEMLHD